MDCIDKKTLEIAQCCKAYNIESLNFDTLADFPGYIFLKSTNSQYIWTNLNLSKVALGTESVDALKNSTDFDFHWKLCADEMRKNDKHVINSRQMIHTIESSQKSNGIIYKLITYKIPVYKKRSLTGLLGISYELPTNKFQSQLTPREQTCIALMSQGFTDKEIAAQLDISPRTVETHINSSKIKLDVHTRAELIVAFCKL